MMIHANERVAEVRKQRSVELQEIFANAGVSYPPNAMFLRAFKDEQELELWVPKLADDGQASPWIKVHTWKVTGRSGGPGPKRREGDYQVPEGVYVIDRYNPNSNFHLSLGLNYPNASDKVRSDPRLPGSDIFIHGGSATVGCLPLGDDGVELLFLTALDAKTNGAAPVRVHIFPFRMEPGSFAEWTRKYAIHAEFWTELLPVYQEFEKSKIPPRVNVTSEGAYQLASEQVK